MTKLDAIKECKRLADSILVKSVDESYSAGFLGRIAELQKELSRVLSGGAS